MEHLLKKSIIFQICDISKELKALLWSKGLTYQFTKNSFAEAFCYTSDPAP